ncbi:FtsK/SpoIIIE domain-containing protein [Cryobacterium cheniae]|uniref:FtsK/SpoIIIE domain-containing protein n=1 Tax=Cryobacterium cheniae TaxID=1259262 RepID=UPI00141B32D5|nr:FtsK/SpoIIIE domain-containing protein [Cryobacterium cheniae]
MIRADVPLTLPSRPADPPPPGFPLIASVAPLAAAGVIWLITGSAFVLIFAVLGPVIAVAGLLDARRTGRRTRRTNAAELERALATLRAEVTLRHEELLRVRWRRTPSANSIAAAPHAHLRWNGSGADVSLGSGAVPSGLRLDGGAGPDEHRDLRDWAATLTDAPIDADAGGGIGIIGPLPLGQALARGLLVQLACSLAPDQVGLTVPERGWEWAASLPHDPGPACARRVVVCEAPSPGGAPSGSSLVVALARTLAELPFGCDTIVRVQGPGRAEILRSGVHAWGTGFRPELITVEQALLVARVLSARAAAAGLVQSARSVPASVALAELTGFRPGRRAREGQSSSPSLRCVIGVGEAGEVSLDLALAGPHAVVGGTTGSGKSELLVTWVAAMAAAAGPDEVTFLLIDFKGGAAFAPLCALPHCVGLITDLDGHQAARALASLAAELRYRERVLGRAGARDIVDLRRQDAGGALPRLVIVVDEFATMLTAFPDLHALFVDIAARGRSLGVHLILCTQRPTGVVRDALLANCTLRVSLRVNNRADSVAVLGTDGAAALGADQPGRCLIAAGASGPVLCQVATTSEREIRTLAAAHAESSSPRRPWLDLLPPTVSRGDLRALVANGTAVDESAPGGTVSAVAHDPAVRGGLLGLVDEPELQRYREARYEPIADGSLLVIGGPRSGKSTALAVLAAEFAPVGAAVLLGADVEAVWDALVQARRRLDAGESPMARLLLLDDFDSVHARWDQEHRPAALELLAGLLRDGAEDGLRIVVAVQRLTGSLPSLTALCQRRLVLRLPEVAEHVAAGAAAALYDDHLPPGGGSWQGHRIQLLAPEPDGALPAAGHPGTAELPDVARLLERPGRVQLVVSGSPSRTARVLESVAGARVVDLAAVPATVLAEAARADPPLRLSEAQAGTAFVGDVDAWQAQWSLLAALRPRADLVFDGCSLADFRAISRRRDLPPPLAPHRSRVWLLSPDGTVRRATLRPPVAQPPVAQPPVG